MGSTILAACIAVTACVGFDSTVVSSRDYLGQRKNRKDLYAGKGARAFYPVFDFEFSPMNRLVLVDVADDPVYKTIELQKLPGHDGKEASIVMLYRHGGSVEFYWSENVARDRQKRPLFADSTVALAEISSRLRVKAEGLDARLALTHGGARLASFGIRETGGRNVVGHLLAPVGALIKHPKSLPLVFLKNVCMVRRSGTDIKVRLRGQKREPKTLTFLFKGPLSYLARYTDHITIAMWNRRTDAKITGLPLKPGATSLSDGGFRYEITYNQGHPELKRFDVRSRDRVITVQFAPPLPDLPAVRKGARVRGRFVVSIDGVEAVIAGRYVVESRAAGPRFVLQPLHVWQPPGTADEPWVSTYKWSADFVPQGDMLRMKARWSRRAD